MSSNNGTSGIGGVRNLRAIFENKPSENQSASPPSRGRSPAHSEASLHSRPVSKVRASFVIVERPSNIEEGQQWGLRKASDIVSMADMNQKLDNDSLLNGASDTSNSNFQMNRINSDSDPQPPQASADDIPVDETTVDVNTHDGLGTILKGSAFEASPPTSDTKMNGTAAKETPASPIPPKKNTTALDPNDKKTPGTQTKSIGSKIKDAISSNHNRPPPSVKLNMPKDAKIIKPPPTRQVPPAKPSARSPTAPGTPRAPASPKTEKPIIRGSAAKPMAVAESAKNAATSGPAKKSPVLPTETRRTSLNTQHPAAAHSLPSSPRTNGVKKDATPPSPEVKPRSTRVPASVAGPTAASTARISNHTTLSRKLTNTRRDPPLARTTNFTAPATKKATRTSLPAQTNGTDRTNPRISAAKKTPDEGFLARMMRPTASSAQKTHEKVAPSSPPQAKRAGPMHGTKSKARGSLTTSDEDKENSHRGSQEMASSPSAAKDRQVEPNGDEKAESHPFKDITPAVEPEEASAVSSGSVGCSTNFDTS